MRKKDAEFELVRLEGQKKVADVLAHLQKKQDQIEDLIKEKRQVEAELETVWQVTTNENRKLKETFLNLRDATAKHNTATDDVIVKPSSTSDYHRLLLLSD